MVEYNAEDGLRVLEYLGINNVTDEEKKVFREKWQRFYRNDLVDAVWKLYAEALPFICGDGDSGSLVASRIRDSDFGRRIGITEIDKELSEGKTLQEIFLKGNHKFVKRVSEDDIKRGNPEIFTS